MSTSKYFNIAKNELFPLCRSITGEGTLKTLKIIKKQFPSLKIFSVKSGDKYFDWKIPLQWDIQDGYVLDNKKKKIIDFKKNNLHVVNYSLPVNKKIFLNELLTKIHTIKKNQNAIPYHTSYYKKYWGFCTTHTQKKNIKKTYRKNDTFHVVIKSKLRRGFLNYGELFIKGKSKQEILISTYICHPSMANNELSGPIVSMSLINFFLKKKKLDKSIRFIFIPETIGAIVFLNKNLKHLKENLIGGYNLTCIGDDRMHSCMLTKYGKSLSDFSLLEAYKKLKIKFKIFSFLKRGSDERQYNSPGIDLPIAAIFRTKYGEYPEYHTSLDDFSVISQKGIKGGFSVAKTAIQILLNKKIPKNNFLCEPFMSKKNLYPKFSVDKKFFFISDLMNFLVYSDGSNDLNSISKYLGKSIKETNKIYNFLLKKKLIR